MIGRWVGGTLLLLALAAPLAGGQGAALLEATYRVEVVVDMADLQEVYANPSEPLPNGQENPLTDCGSERFTYNSSARWFRFREGPTENGCGEVQYTVAVPRGTTDVEVTFRSDRTIQQSSTAADLPKNMIQELRLYDEDGSLLSEFPYFDKNFSAEPTPVPFSYVTEVRPGQSSVTVGWHFVDEGETLGFPLVGGQGFSGSVADPRVLFSGIPIADTEVTDERLGLEGDGVGHATHVRVPIPESLGPQGGISALIRVPADLTFSHAVAPGGERVHAGHVETSETQGVREVVLTTEATAQHGTGDYDVVFLSSTALAPSVALYPFIIAVMFVPIGAGILSLRGARELQRNAPIEFQRTATTLHNVIIGLLAAYLLIPILILASGRLQLLASWPLEGEAGLVYLLIGLAFVAFVGIGLLERQHLAGIMAQEVEMQEQARRELERSNRELEEFAYVASHDLQEPLRAVASYTQLLQRRYKGKLDKDADEYIGSAVEGAHRMQALIQDLLAYSRVGSKPEPHTMVDLGEVARQVVNVLRPTIEEAGATVDVGTLPTVLGNERQFMQLLQNLMGNALKFKHPDRTPRVSLDATKVGNVWRIEVKDNGIGIEPQHYGRIFQIFQRLHGRNEYPGTGIGLAVCKRIVELRGGEIGVESTPGEGSTFFFTIPESPPMGRAARFLGKGDGQRG